MANKWIGIMNIRQTIRLYSQGKALVEIAVKLVYQRIYSELRGLNFYSIEELNAAIFDLFDTYNSIRFANRD